MTKNNQALIKAINRANKINSIVKALKNQYGVYGYSVADGIGYTWFLLKDWS